jgi:hypothetical protein
MRRSYTSLRRDSTKRMMTALAPMGRDITHCMFQTRARFILSKPGAFHLLFSITRVPWQSRILSSGYMRAASR